MLKQNEKTTEQKKQGKQQKRSKTSFEAYLKNVAAVPMLSREETKALFQALENGDENAKQKLIEANLRLVISIAKQYAKPGIGIEDLVSEGNIGLMKAIDRFEWKRNFALSTYATWWIKQSIARYIVNKERTIRLPAHVIGINKKKAKIVEDYKKKFGVEPSDDEIADLAGLSDKMINATRDNRNTISLNSQKYNNSDESEIIDHIEDYETQSPDDAIAASEMREVISQALSKLTPKEEIVIRLRFGIYDDPTNSSKWPVTASELEAIKAGKGLTG